MRGLKRGPLLVAVAACVVISLFGAALVGEALGTWYEGLEKPWFLVPLWASYAVGVYLAFTTVLARVLVHVEDRGRGGSPWP